MTFSFSAEWLKTKNSLFRTTLYSSPILFNLLIFGYIFFTHQRVSESSFYSNYFSILNFLLPFTVSFIVALMNNCEREAGNFKNIFGLNHHYYFLLSQKFIFSYLVISFVFLFNSFLTIMLLKFTFNVSSIVFYSHFFYGFALTWMSFITSYIIYFFLSIICSLITTLFIGLISSLLTAIVGLTALGNGIWILFPFTWGIRFITISINNKSLVEFFYEHTNLSYVLLVSPIICFLVFIIICVSLFRK
ncbi:lantibiotic ABC transporter [Enterococcus faecalis]|nr:lantibiotic ABC transporter [Enterococcus faecalis]